MQQTVVALPSKILSAHEKTLAGSFLTASVLVISVKKTESAGRFDQLDYSTFGSGRCISVNQVPACGLINRFLSSFELILNCLGITRFDRFLDSSDLGAKTAPGGTIQ